ncbi:MAG: NYN domain-containing protein [Deltaproteobacteria bacterium]|jgi:hypothetical protein|nr:NYN domain-containing protein [Deltaproteobacteria bacterium]
MEANFNPEQPSLKTAVLIDATSFPVEVSDVVFSILSQYGEIVVKRAFGNWSKPESRPWAERLALYAVVPAQRFDYPADASVDVDMTIEALDLLKNKKINSFALVTGSGGLGRLAIRLRESGAMVFGFANAPAANGPFRTACSLCWSVEELKALRDNEPEGAEEELIQPVWEDEPKEKEEEEAQNVQAQSPVGLSRFKGLLKQAVAENEGEDGWALLSSVGSSIKVQWPNFNPSDLGYKGLKNMVEEARDIVRVNSVSPCKVRLLDDFN